jgi:exopolysaccharide biosynthesis polyprenyl glycosylphosphotransferase
MLVPEDGAGAGLLERDGAAIEARDAAGWSLPRVLRRDALLRRALAASDVASCAVGLLLAVKLVRDCRLDWGVLVALAIVVPLAKVMGLYDRDELLLRKSTLEEAPKLLRLATAYTLWVWILAPVVVHESLFRDQILSLWGALIVLLPVGRMATRTLLTRATAPERCMVVGEPCVCEELQSKLSGRGVNATIAFALQFESPEDEALEMTALARSERLRELAQTSDVHRIIIAPHDSDAEHIRDLVQAANAIGLHVSIVPRMLEVIGSTVQFDDVNGLTVLGVQRFGLGRSSRALKRAMDVAGSLFGLIVLSPLFAAIALAIKLGSKGPVFFVQRRVGLDGKEFGMVKFRTMVEGADAMRESLAVLNEASEGLFKIEKDPRITRVGRLLRSLSIDELPQLWNVLRGEMSLVGPRPLVVYEDDYVEGFYRERLSLTPGMTGRWQILGSARIPLGEMVKLDYLYVANWSIWSDFKILLRTVPFVLGRRGL